MEGNVIKSKNTVVFILILIGVGTMYNIQLGSCRSPFDDIIAGYTRNSVTLRGNLTYSTAQWYFNVQSRLIFNLTIDVPNNTTVELNISRLLLFLEFREEDSDFNFVLLLNQTDFGHFSFTNSSVVISDSYTVTVDDAHIGFIPEDYNWVVLGFLVTLDINIISDTTPESIEDVNIYSSKPESVSWIHPSGMFTWDNEDHFHIWSYSYYNDPFLSFIQTAVLFSFFPAIFILSCYCNSDFRKRRKASKLKTYLSKKVEIHGRVYSLGGIRISLAYYMFLVLPEGDDYYGKVVSTWVSRTAKLNLLDNIDSSEISKEEEPLWYDLRRNLSINARGIDIYLYKQFSRKERAIELIKQLRKYNFEVSEETTSWIESNINREVEEEYSRVNPSGELFTELRNFVETCLSLLIPKELSQLRGAIIQLEEKTGPDVFAATALTLRDIVQNLLYTLVTDQVLPLDSVKSSKDKTRENFSYLVNWMKLQLKGTADKPLGLVEQWFDTFFDYTYQLDSLVHRDVHKRKAELRREEIIGHIMNLYSWMNELFILLERADYDWPQ